LQVVSQVAVPFVTFALFTGVSMSGDPASPRSGELARSAGAFYASASADLAP